MRYTENLVRFTVLYYTNCFIIQYQRKIMKFKITYPSTVLFVLLIIIQSVGCNQKFENEPGEDEEYDEPAKAAMFQKLRTHDPLTGEVPQDKMWQAILQTEEIKNRLRSNSNFISALTWQERGSNSDALGPSNGNSRANNGVTSGRIDAILVDAGDATGKTVWVGGRGGGLWKTTDITASPATWVLVNDFLSNLSISGITQDPTNPDIMYFCTGESYGEANDLRGNGVFKSTDHGVTWTQLASTNNSSFYYCPRILCDYQGNIYVGTRTGLYRSTKASGGAAWTNITPSGATSPRVCDLDISSTSSAGRLHVVFGVFSTRTYFFTDIPSTVAAGTWTSPTSGFPTGSQRAEIGVSGNTLYCIPCTAAYQVTAVYKSTDGGATWATTPGTPPTTASGGPFANGQGWYDLTVAINPANSNECIIGGIDNAKTTNGGTTWTRISNWVGTTGQYVHADQHASIWYDNGNKLLFGCDGGIFYSSNGGTTIRDRNVGLRLKQFYSVAVHPSTTDYFLAGAQDNGTHQFTNPGLSSSIEVFGGDGANVAIDQDQPQYQTGAYVYSNYRRSSNSGATWSFGSSNNNGQFINPYDYDNLGNKVYACYTAGNYLRWENPQSGFTYTTVPIAAFGGQMIGAVCVSPYTANRVYFGMASGGKIIRVDGANGASPTATDITGSGMPTGTQYMNCINTGSSDQILVACYSNYGTNNIWISSNGGTSWTNIDGNLPDIPVYWAMYNPNDNSKMIIATETGVWETDAINGASTIWTPSTSFPTARATMLKYRSSDGLIAASSYGRGLWTAILSVATTPDIQFENPSGSSTEATAATSGCRGYTDYTANMRILNAPTGNAIVTLNVVAGGSARQGVDYDITTNGNFASPSMVLNFPNGSTALQPFTIRVYDDAALESPESFTLNYSISGSSNAQPGTTNQTYTYTINDNDAAPLAASTGTSSSIGSLNYITSGGLSCFYSSKNRHKIQYLVTKDELNTAGITSAGNLTSLTFRVYTKNSTKAFTGFTVSMANTSITSFSNFISPTFTQVYSGNYTTQLGNNTINFSTNFAWDGTSNVVINLCYQNATADALDDILECDLPALTANYAVYANYTSGSTAGCSLPAAYISTYRPNIVFGYSLPGTPVSTALNSSKTAYLGPYDDVYFYDGSGNIMARIKNLGAFDYGCTQVIIDRAGSSAVPFWNNNVNNYFLSKSFKVIPTNNTSSGDYQITLYYTNSEVTNWQSATGNSWGNAQVGKVSNGFYIPDVTPAAPHVGDVIITNGTAGTLGSNYTITGNFASTGFSGFGVGISGQPLPIDISYFNGNKQGLAHILNWKVNCNASPRATMVLQRSKDAANFSQLYAITADAARCNQPFTYTDANPLVGMNYYRLKITDVDGKVKYSAVVPLMNTIKGYEILTVSPNPVKGNTINLRIASSQAINLQLAISDAGGRVLQKQNINLAAGYNSTPINIGKLAAGTYYIYGFVNGNKSKPIAFVKQ